MAHEATDHHSRPVVAIGVAVGMAQPRLLTLTDTARYGVVSALAAFDALPPDFPSYAHRVVIRDALAAARVPSTPATSVRDARAFLGLPNVGLQ